VEEILPRVFVLVLVIGAVGTPVLARRKHRDVGRWVIASLGGLWMTAAVSFLAILMFSDLQKLPEDKRAGSIRREKCFCWTMVAVGALLWYVLLTML
jgi:hypothetical protein